MTNDDKVTSRIIESRCETIRRSCPLRCVLLPRLLSVNKQCACHEGGIHLGEVVGEGDLDAAVGFETGEGFLDLQARAGSAKFKWPTKCRVVSGECIPHNLHGSCGTGRSERVSPMGNSGHRSTGSRVLATITAIQPTMQALMTYSPLQPRAKPSCPAAHCSGATPNPCQPSDPCVKSAS